MRKKYKLTGFARLFLFMIFFLPITFTIATVAQGDNPIDIIKEKLPIENFLDRDGSSQASEKSIDLSDYENTITELQNQIEKLETQNMLKDAEIKALKDVIKKQ